MDWSLPGSSVHGLSQARILEWVPASFVINSHPVCTAGHSGQYLLGNRAVTPGRGALPGARAKAVKALLQHCFLPCPTAPSRTAHQGLRRCLSAFWLHLTASLVLAVPGVGAGVHPAPSSVLLRAFAQPVVQCQGPDIYVNTTPLEYYQLRLFQSQIIGETAAQIPFFFKITSYCPLVKNHNFSSKQSKRMFSQFIEMNWKYLDNLMKQTYIFLKKFPWEFASIQLSHLAILFYFFKFCLFI